MVAGRRSARRQAVFALYRQDLLNVPLEAALRGSLDKEADQYTIDLLRGTSQYLADIDRALEEHLADWDLQRLGVVERSILRIAAYELLFEQTVPAAVVIDEAVELAKRYCSTEAAALVNGVLGSIATEAQRDGPPGKAATDTQL